MDQPGKRKHQKIARFGRDVLLAFGLALGLFYLLMKPPPGEFGLMTQLMAITALLSMLAAFGAYRLGWIHRSPRIRLTLMGGYALSGLLVFLNVWVIASLMFASRHDLLLATVLLVFASGIAMAVGYFLSEALTDRILVLRQAARQIAQGRLESRVPLDGRDEMAELAAAFNEMAARLQASDQKQRELEAMRRDLTAWAGHDLRTPLTSIRAILEALADGLVEEPETMRRYLKTAQRDIRSLTHLIEDLFEMSQIDAGGLRLDLQPCALRDLVSDTIESFSELAGREGVTLEGTVEEGIDPLCMDTQRIGRVLNNLVSNALRYTPAGGSVFIGAKLASDAALVEVSNSGEGIRSEDLPHVFERFYRGEKSRSRATGGAGLGLAIARGIIEAHGGQIWVESQPGQGARFVFSLPK